MSECSLRAEVQNLPEQMTTIWIGRNPWRNGDEEVPHVHNGNEWNLLLEGNTRRMIDGKVYPCPRGSLTYLPRDSVHSMLQSPSSLHLWVIWDLRGPRETSPGVFTLPEAQCRELDALCRLVHEHRKEQDPSLAFHHLHLALRTLLSARWRAAADPVQGARLHPALQQAIELLHECSGLIELEDLAAQVGISRSRLSHLFTEQMDQSLHRYRSRVQLQAFDEARKHNPNAKLQDIARACGFSNYTQCYRTHCRVRGVPPSGLSL